MKGYRKRGSDVDGAGDGVVTFSILRDTDPTIGSDRQPKGEKCVWKPHNRDPNAPRLDEDRVPSVLARHFANCCAKFHPTRKPIGKKGHNGSTRNGKHWTQTTG